MSARPVMTNTSCTMRLAPTILRSVSLLVQTSAAWTNSRSPEESQYLSAVTSIRNSAGLSLQASVSFAANGGAGLANCDGPAAGREVRGLSPGRLSSARRGEHSVYRPESGFSN